MVRVCARFGASSLSYVHDVTETCAYPLDKGDVQVVPSHPGCWVVHLPISRFGCGEGRACLTEREVEVLLEQEHERALVEGWDLEVVLHEDRRQACPTCNGRGELHAWDGERMRHLTCSRCEGCGKVGP